MVEEPTGRVQGLSGGKSGEQRRCRHKERWGQGGAVGGGGSEVARWRWPGWGCSTVAQPAVAVGELSAGGRPVARWRSDSFIFIFHNKCFRTASRGANFFFLMLRKPKKTNFIWIPTINGLPDPMAVSVWAQSAPKNLSSS